jgi:hypothetical protein
VIVAKHADPRKRLRRALIKLITTAAQLDLGKLQQWHRWIYLNYSKQHVEAELKALLEGVPRP